MEDNLRIFISYSWDNEEHKIWVRQLADKLINDGIEVFLDQYDLSLGKSIIQFAEKSLKKSDRVIVVFTPNYLSKAENKRGGVGFEYSIINQEIYNNQSQVQRFIPILRRGEQTDSIPIFMHQYIYLNFNDDTKFEENYENLVRDIYSEPKIEKPKLGKKPNFRITRENLSDDLCSSIIELAHLANPKGNTPKDERIDINHQIEKIGSALELDEILKLANSDDNQHKVAAGICLKSKIKESKIDYGTNREVQEYIKREFSSESRNVRYRIMQVINESNTLLDLLIEELKVKVNAPQGFLTKKEMQKAIRNYTLKDITDINDLKAVIHSLLNEGKTEVALEKLCAFFEESNDENQKDVILLRATLSDNNRNFRLRLIDESQIQITKNRINFAILEIVGKISDDTWQKIDKIDKNIEG